jgi:hypothetical protein
VTSLSGQNSWIPAVPGQNDKIPAGWTRSGRSSNLDGNGQNSQDGRDLAVSRTKWPDPARLDEIWPFPAITTGSRPACGDARNLALPRPDWPEIRCRGEWSGISGGMLCFRHAIFTNRWNEHFCLYVLKYFLIYFTIKLMWSHL